MEKGINYYYYYVFEVKTYGTNEFDFINLLDSHNIELDYKEDFYGGYVKIPCYSIIFMPDKKKYMFIEKISKLCKNIRCFTHTSFLVTNLENHVRILSSGNQDIKINEDGEVLVCKYLFGPKPDGDLSKSYIPIDKFDWYTVCTFNMSDYVASSIGAFIKFGYFKHYPNLEKEIYEVLKDYYKNL